MWTRMWACIKFWGQSLGIRARCNVMRSTRMKYVYDRKIFMMEKFTYQLEIIFLFLVVLDEADSGVPMRV